MAGVVRVGEADDRSLIVLVDWVGFEVDERKLRVTRAIAARIKRDFGIQL